jgi:hypothetical protein
MLGQLWLSMEVSFLLELHPQACTNTDVDADLPYCGSDCTATGGVAPSLAAMVSMNFPHVDPSNFTSYIQPNAGHGINFHYNATAGYQVIQEFLGSKNLQIS